MNSVTKTSLGVLASLFVIVAALVIVLRILNVVNDQQLGDLLLKSGLVLLVLVVAGGLVGFIANFSGNDKK